MVLGSAQQGKWMGPLHSAPCRWSSLETPGPISLLLLLRVEVGKVGGGKAGPGQGSSTEKGGSKGQHGICLSQVLAKGHRELTDSWSTKPKSSSGLEHSGILQWEKVGGKASDGFSTLS